MANLIVCCDGTWNSPDNQDDGEHAPTNVYKLFSCIELADTGHQQLSRYQSGVGTGGIIDKAMGGVIGYGLSEDIRDCYQWLCNKYSEGDRICLFGFSRGAFTARSLAGLIGKFGIIHFDLGDKRSKLVKKVYEKGYRKQANIDELNINFYPNSNHVHFIGVWDTVGALGVPDDKVLLNIFDNPKKYRFHDTKLGSHINIARHAVALDEKRGSFTPTLWADDQNADMKQVWFPGVHADVGGGYKETGLSDCALQWMIEEASEAGIKFDPVLVEQLEPNPQDVKHDSHTGAMKALVSAPRSIPELSNSDCIHSSVVTRRRSPPINQSPYLPTRSFDNGAIELDIYAKHPWFWTGIYLQANKEYHFLAEGEWMDASITSGPNGTHDNDFHVGEIAHLTGTVISWFEKGWKKLFASEQADFFGTKRVENADWFTLMGAIADGDNPNIDGTHQRLSYFNIGENAIYTPKKSGYLYCFANDAWGFYHNNRGYVTLTVAEVE